LAEASNGKSRFSSEELLKEAGDTALMAAHNLIPGC